MRGSGKVSRMINEYWRIHSWISYHYGSANIYSCIVDEAHRGKKEWANIDGVYEKDIQHFRVLCIYCHRKYDMIMPMSDLVEVIRNSAPIDIPLRHKVYVSRINNKKTVKAKHPRKLYKKRAPRVLQPKRHPLAFYFPELQ